MQSMTPNALRMRLKRAGLNVSRIDAMAFELLADQMHLVRESGKQIRERGLMIEDEDGKETPSPYIRINKEATSRALDILKSLGATPASRIAIVNAMKLTDIKEIEIALKKIAKKTKEEAPARRAENHASDALQFVTNLVDRANR